MGSWFATRTGLPPAGDDELMLDQVISRDHLQLWRMLLSHEGGTPPWSASDAPMTGMLAC
jgi:hypothetical protein